MKAITEFEIQWRIGSDRMSNVWVAGSIEKDKHSLLSTRSNDNLEEETV